MNTDNDTVNAPQVSDINASAVVLSSAQEPAAKPLSPIEVPSIEDSTAKMLSSTTDPNAAAAKRRASRKQTENPSLKDYIAFMGSSMPRAKAAKKQTLIKQSENPAPDAAKVVVLTVVPESEALAVIPKPKAVVVAGTVESLTPAEQRDLDDRVANIKALRSRAETCALMVYEAIADLFDHPKLWGGRTWVALCKEEFGINHTVAYDWKDYGHIIKALRSFVMPKNSAVAESWLPVTAHPMRPIRHIADKPQLVIDIWASAHDESGNKPITEKLVQKIVDKIAPQAKKPKKAATATVEAVPIGAAAGIEALAKTIQAQLPALSTPSLRDDARQALYNLRDAINTWIDMSDTTGPVPLEAADVAALEAAEAAEKAERLSKYTWHWWGALNEQNAKLFRVEENAKKAIEQAAKMNRLTRRQGIEFVARKITITLDE